MNFSWSKLKKPFFVMAPMEGATDSAFRQVIGQIGKPEVMVTEFVNVEGLVSVGKPRLEHMLKLDPSEQPVIVQLWGLKPENFKTISSEMVERGFSGIDINMGCPVKDVIKKGTGSALINTPSLAAEIIAAVKEGVNGKIPVSVKTRIGFNHIATESWCGFLLSQNLDALTVHGRTTKELSKVPAHWDQIGQVVRLKTQINPHTIIIGNGDVDSMARGRELAQAHGVDGVMIGRGVFNNPWVFNSNLEGHEPDAQTKINTLILHLKTYQSVFADAKPYDPLKRFFKIYIHGFNGASYLREQLMLTKTFAESIKLLLSFKSQT